MTESSLNNFLNHNIITNCILNPKVKDGDILPKVKLLPCHNQATEICAKVTSEDFSSVCDTFRYDGCIKSFRESGK